MQKLFADLSVVESAHFGVHQDWEIPIPAFFIVAAKRMLRTWGEFTPAEAYDFISIICNVRRGMAEALGIRDVYYFQNEDTEHNFHLWMFPRHAWMEKFGRKIESVRPIMEYAKQHLATNDDIREVHEAAQKMKRYLQAITQ